MEDKETLYARVLSGDLTQDEITNLKASGEWKEIGHIVQVMDEVEIIPLDIEKSLEKLHIKKAKRIQKVRRLNTLWKICAAASILLLFGLFFHQQNKVTTVSADLASNETYKLPDNSTVILNDGSAISFDNKLWDQERTISLTGEAFFKVEKGNPFVVETDKGTVEVLGTTFNVKSWGTNFSVQCFTGIVKVSSNGQQFILNKGDAIHFIEGKGVEKKIKLSTPAWTNATSTFYEEDLNTVFEEIERQFKTKIKSPVFNKKFTGSFTHDSLNQALYEVCTPMGISYSINGSDHVTISK